MPIIDTHTHLNDERLKPIAEQIVSDFGTDNIAAVVNVGYDFQSSLSAYEQSQKYDSVYSAVGIHPHDSKTADVKMYGEFEKLAKNQKVVAIGEIGLDYFYDLSDRQTQKRVFREQLELADALKLPVILHVRDAYEDARRILFDAKRFLNNGVQLHCYSGSSEFVKIFDQLDCFYSFGGAITFKNAKHNIEALNSVPKDRLLLETDCPYMTPVPFRGQTNYPKFINLVADKMRLELGLEKEELESITSYNAKTLFKKINI